MSYLEDKLRKGTVKALVREKAEDIWRREGTLDSDDNIYRVANHPYIYNSSANKVTAYDYFTRMVDTSKEVEKFVQKTDPSFFWERISGQKVKVEMETKPYGVHLYIAMEDLKKVKPYFDDNGISGIVLNYDDGGIPTAVGKRSETWEEYIGCINVELSERLKKYGTNLFLKELEEQYRIANHELEHLHNSFENLPSLKGETCALNELIAFFNPYALIKGISLGPKEYLEPIYKSKMGEHFDDFFYMATKTRNGKFFKGKNMQAKILPMVLLEIKDFSNVNYHFEEVLDKVSKLRI